MVTLRLTVLILAGLSAYAQPRTHRDPGGRFSVPIPAGWTATPAGESVVLTAGGAYALVTVIEGGGAEPRRVAQFTDQFGRQWPQYKRIQTGTTTLGGRSGAFALYSGTNPKGVDAIVKAISAPAGAAAHLVIFSCPVAEWEQRKPAMETIERGFAFGAGGATAAAPRSTPAAPPQTYNPPASPTPNRPAPTAARPLPNGFKVAARNGGSGQALTASFTGGKSARATFRGIFKFVGSYFDSPPQLRAAFADPQDREIQGFFHSVHQGVPVRGVMVVTVDGTNGYVGLLFDRPDLFNQSMPVLSKQMAASLPQGTAPEVGGGGGGPRRPEPLQRQNLLDGSGWISLPAGWRITGSFKGVVDAAGPAGQLVSLGGYTAGYTNPLPGTPANLMTGPYRGPLQALPAYIDSQFQRALSRGISRYETIEHTPIPYQGGQGAYILFKITGGGKSQTGLAMVCTAPVDNLQWYYYNSIVSAPSERFERDLPTLWEIWKSWSVNPAVFRERMDAALRSMRETTRILMETNENTRRTYDNVNHAWSQVIRGVTTVENVVTRVRTDVDTNVVNRVVEDLNAQGYNYRVVPLPELIG
jgi:hypothetical protein